MLLSANMKWSVSANRCRSHGWLARLNISIDCSVGVTESTEECSSRIGRPARLADHVVGAEVVHALRGLGGELLDRVLRQMAAQMLGDRHDVVARHHQRLAGLLAVALALRQHVGELLPGCLARMLAAEFPLAVAPAARRDRRGHALVDAADIDRDGGAEARADHADAVAARRSDSWRGRSARRSPPAPARGRSDCRAGLRSRRSPACRCAA